MTMPNADGPDISHYQTPTGQPPDPSWRVWSHKATEGQGYRDPTFAKRWQWFREMGVRYRGAYHWLRSDSTPALQVANLKRTLDVHGGLQVGEFIQIDWETTKGIPNLTLDQVETFQRLCEQTWPGRCIMYGSDWVPNFTAWRQRNPSYPLWYANYNTSSTNPAGGWAECEKWNADVWQWTSLFTHPSFTGRFDMNMIRNVATLDRLTLQAEEPPDMPTDLEYMANSEADPAKPWLLRQNGQWSYLSSFDHYILAAANVPVYSLNAEQYPWALRSAGLDDVHIDLPNPMPVTVANWPPPTPYLISGTAAPS